MKDNYVDLLFVQDGTYRQVVQVPAHQADVGDQVEYIVPGEKTEIGFADVPEETRMGLVVKKIWCERFDNTWSCIAEIATIHQGKQIWKPGWRQQEPDET